MDIFETKGELQRLSRGDLFKLVMDQRLSKCLVGGMTCGFYLQYKGTRFCLSELLGKGCLIERLGQWDQFYSDKGNNNDSLTFLRRIEAEVFSSGKKPVEFKVYYRNDSTRSMDYLGTVIERRRKERGNNLRDLLKKAVAEYSHVVQDPSKIFLLGY